MAKFPVRQIDSLSTDPADSLRVVKVDTGEELLLEGIDWDSYYIDHPDMIASDGPLTITTTFNYEDWDNGR